LDHLHLSSAVKPARPSWADNCTGYDVLMAGPSETTDLGQGMKLTSWKAQSVLLRTLRGAAELVF
jgi:hypothetical protein